MTTTDHELEAVEVPSPEAGVMTAISRAELDSQITTARAYPRSLKRFRDECLEMACLNEEIAGECFYAIPRDGKTIEGPSARLAEIVASAWGNCHYAARIVEEGQEFITAQGVFYDIERNVRVTMEVRRRITGRNGRRFSADMIGVTGNAACSIAMRNAVFKGISKAFWKDIYQAARRTSVGDAKSLAATRASTLEFLQKQGALLENILARLDVAGVQDIGMDELVTLKGASTAIRDGDISVDDAFPTPVTEETVDATSGNEGLKKSMQRKKGKGKKTEHPEPDVPDETDKPSEPGQPRTVDQDEEPLLDPDELDESAETKGSKRARPKKELLEIIGALGCTDAEITSQATDLFSKDGTAILDITKLAPAQLERLLEALSG